MAITSAGDPFDPIPTKETGGMVLTVERNQMVWNPYEMQTYNYRVNKDDFQDKLSVGDIGRWLCKPPTARRVYKGPVRYWRARYEFHECGPDFPSWDHIMLNKGHRYFDAAGVKKTFIPTGQVSIAMLKADGTKLPEPIVEADINYLTFKKYRSVAFAPLKIVTE